MLATYAGTVRGGKPVLFDAVTLPENSQIIITILDKSVMIPMQSEKSHTSAYGCLRKYANPALIPEEDGAWEQAAGAKYANS